MSFFPANKVKDPQKDRRILSFIEQDLDKINASSPSSDNIIDEDYDDAPIKKLKTVKQTPETSIILIDDSEDSSSSLINNQNNYKNNRQTGFNNNQQNLLPPHLSPYNHQPLPYFPQYISPEYPKINLLNQFPYQQNLPNSFPQGNNKPPTPQSQEKSSYQPFRPGPPNSFNPQIRPQEPQIPLQNQKSTPVNNRLEESKGVAMETEQQNKTSASQENLQKMPVSELAKRASIAKKTSKGRPKEGEGTSGNGAAFIQPTQTNKIPEKTNSDRLDLQKSQKEAIKTVDKSLKLDTPIKSQDQKEISKQNIPRSPITPPGSKTAKKPGSGASVPVFAKQRTEERKNDEKKSPEKVLPKKQRHMKNISLFQPSNQELHELIAKELNEDDEIEVDTELTLNELIVNYSNRHQNKKCPSLSLHEYFELIEAPRHKPEEYPVNYKQFL